MAALSFMSQRRQKPRVAYFDHGTTSGSAARQFVASYCATHSLELRVGELQNQKPKGASQEEHWRNERYLFLHSLDGPVVMAHNLNDCMETWVFTALNGDPKLIPYSNRNVVRPFLATPKSEFIRWCTRHMTPWLEDTSNTDVRYTRNRIRRCIMPEALVINPGLYKVIKKKLLSRGIE